MLKCQGVHVPGMMGPGIFTVITTQTINRQTAQQRSRQSGTGESRDLKITNHETSQQIMGYVSYLSIIIKLYMSFTLLPC